MRVAMLFDGISALGPTPDLLILGTVEAVEQALVAHGHEVTRVPVNPDARWIERMRRGKFDLAFNLCEGIDGAADLESPVVGALELIGVPYTGASSWTTALCLRKPLVNTLLDVARIPVPRWTVARRGEPIATVGFPAICKPANEDASLGIEQRSVVRNTKQLAQRVSAMHELWEEVIVQRFIDGREVNVGIVGHTVLPVGEIDFRDMPDGMWRIVSYRSKWECGSDEDLGAVPKCPADLPAAVVEEISRLALASWETVGGCGYGRVDMRIDSAGRPWILEVNANPDFAPDAGLARMAKVGGLEYDTLVMALCDEAMSRRKRTTLPNEWSLAQRLCGLGGVPAPLIASGQQ